MSVAGPPLLFYNTGILDLKDKECKVEESGDNYWLFGFGFFLKKKEKKFLCILIAEQFAYLCGKQGGKKKKA